MVNLFEFNDYKSFVNLWISQQENRGRGELQRIAKALSIHPTLVSHVFRGKKNLSLEQASRLCHHFDLSVLETDYFLLLVQRAKSGAMELSKVLDRQINDLKIRAKSLVNRVMREAELSEEDKAVFYSSWYYSGIRLITSIPGLNTKQQIHACTGLPPSLVQEVLEFLAAKGLCQFDGNIYSLGPALTHLEVTSRFISRHHTNWRLKVIENHPRLTEDDLVFTGPLTISKKDAAIVREKIVQFIKELGETVKNSPGEELHCFNIDWVEILRL